MRVGRIEPTSRELLELLDELEPVRFPKGRPPADRYKDLETETPG